jgi:NAD(P) transhydrogenase subunit alpha
MEDGRWKMEDGRWKMEDGRWREGKHLSTQHPTPNLHSINNKININNKNMENVLTFLWENKDMIFIIVLSIFLGFEVISNVPSVLHTPLMSGANAISGVIIIGGIILVGHADTTLEWVLGIFAVLLGTLNVAGGFVVTDRMLEMFKKKKQKK